MLGRWEDYWNLLQRTSSGRPPAGARSLGAYSLRGPQVVLSPVRLFTGNLARIHVFTHLGPCAAGGRCHRDYLAVTALFYNKSRMVGSQIKEPSRGKGSDWDDTWSLNVSRPKWRSCTPLALLGLSSPRDPGRRRDGAGHPKSRDAWGFSWGIPPVVLVWACLKLVYQDYSILSNIFWQLANSLDFEITRQHSIVIKCPTQKTFNK